MAENTAPATNGTNGDVPGQPFYEKARVHLTKLLEKKRVLERTLAQQEDLIYKRETDYLEETPTGNIIIGFENYTKGGSSAESPPNSSSQSTPVAQMVPTPLSTSFQKGEGASNHATPTSATSANRTGAGVVKKGNKRAGEDSETDTKDAKKARTNSTTARK
ncbi:hypothetical protein B7494_g5154 [Chlorociboria aeruginascens]|nr:hypothetical protein B7494_g5154 [Chlorociboria aeruginascens]